MQNEPLEEYKLKLKDLDLPPLENFKRLECPACQAKITADQINIQDKIAKCGSCHAIFPFEQTIKNFLSPSNSKHDMLKPEGIDLFYYKDELDITFQQPFSVLDGLPLLILIFAGIISTGIYFKHGGEFQFYWMCFYWALSLFPIYNLFQRKNHHVHVTVDEVYLHIMWRPKKMIKDRKILVREIAQIYVKLVNEGYALFAVVNGPDGQRHEKLISGMTTPAKAKYLEQEIEKHLHIEDRPVADEVK